VETSAERAVPAAATGSDTHSGGIAAA